EEEIEALVLGARVVKSFADPTLSNAADDVLAKVEAVLPQRLKDRIAATTLFALNFRKRENKEFTLLRQAIKGQRKVEITDEDRAQAKAARIVQPLGLFYWGTSWSLGAWCELREDFRNFRLDRMASVVISNDVFESIPGRRLEDFFRHYEEGAQASSERADE